MQLGLRSPQHSWKNLLGATGVVVLVMILGAGMAPDAGARGSAGELSNPTTEPAEPKPEEPPKHKRPRWNPCSHLSPWNGVYFEDDLGASVTEVRRISCRRAARVLSRSELDEDGRLRIKRWRCRSEGEARYGASYTMCKRDVRGRTKKLKVIVGH